MDNLFEVIKTILVLAIVLGCIYFSYRAWTLGDNEEDYKTVCIEGHEYWRASFAGKGFLAIKVNERGGPVRCKIPKLDHS